MPKIKESSYPKSIEAYKNDPQFYEELTILKAQEKIAELMKNSNTTRTELAAMLNQSKAHVTELLSDGRNLTLRTFARVCFYLKTEIEFQTYLIGSKYSAQLTSDSDFNSAYQFIGMADWLSSADTHKYNSNTSSSKIKNKSTSTDSYNKIMDTYNQNVNQFTKTSIRYSKAA